MYCMKCKKQTGDKNVKIVKSGNRNRKTGQCTVCGTNKSQFIGKLKGGNADISAEAYVKPSERKKEIDGYVLDEDLNKRDIAVYKNPETGKTLISSRGTDVTKKKKAISDLAEDGLITLGLSNTGLSKRNKKLTKVAKQVVEREGKENVSLTGHSLGGRTAMNTAEKLGLKADVYAPGSSPLDIPANLLGKKNKNIKIHSTGIDPVSAVAYYTKKTKKEKSNAKGLDPHGIYNFQKPKK